MDMYQVNRDALARRRAMQLAAEMQYGGLDPRTWGFTRTLMHGLSNIGAGIGGAIRGAQSQAARCANAEQEYDETMRNLNLESEDVDKEAAVRLTDIQREFDVKTHTVQRNREMRMSSIEGRANAALTRVMQCRGSSPTVPHAPGKKSKKSKGKASNRITHTSMSTRGGYLPSTGDGGHWEAL
jgi:hypothetical protein